MGLIDYIPANCGCIFHSAIRTHNLYYYFTNQSKVLQDAIIPLILTKASLICWNVITAQLGLGHSGAARGEVRERQMFSNEHLQQTKNFSFPFLSLF